MRELIKFSGGLFVILGALTCGVGVAISVIQIFSGGPVAGFIISIFAGASVILLGGSPYVLCSIEERLERAERKLAPADNAFASYVSGPSPAKPPIGIRFARQDGGLIISFVQDRSRGAAAGLLVGDIIASIDGVPVETVADATAQFEKNGSETQLGITRAGTPLSIVVK
jgi:membrane-associated protease RseP (regulator of RpoE activity)